MELFREILTRDCPNGAACPAAVGFTADAARLVETECYQALKKIKAVIEDDSLSDGECFERIEKIVCIFEALGSSGGNRHDFG